MYADRGGRAGRRHVHACHVQACHVQACHVHTCHVHTCHVQACHVYIPACQVAIELLDGPYDAIIIDCMVSGIIPPSCKSASFTARAVTILSQRGLIAQWVWRDQRATLSRAYATQHVFASVHNLPYVAPSGGQAQLQSNAHPDGEQCDRWAALDECTVNARFMAASCAQSCYIALATASADSPELAAMNSWLVFTDSPSTARVACNISFARCPQR